MDSRSHSGPTRGKVDHRAQCQAALPGNRDIRSLAAPSLLSPESARTRGEYPCHGLADEPGEGYPAGTWDRPSGGRLVAHPAGPNRQEKPREEPPGARTSNRHW
jgi:hypothetical protein